MQIPDSNATPLEHQSEPPHAVPAEVPEALEEDLGEGMQDGPRDVPRPIGREGLRKLRESIENGTYPSEDDVSAALDQLFTRP